MIKLKESLLTYILLAFGISFFLGVVWAFLLNPLDTLMKWENKPISNLLLKFGPSIAGLIACRINFDSKKTIDLLKSGFHVVVPWKVIFVSIGGPFFGMPISISVWSAEVVNQIFTWTYFSTLLPILGLKLFLGGGLGEEFGWRGFMQPVLQTKHSWVNASIIVAFFWVLWHLPSTVLGGELGNPIVFVVTLIGYSIILAWIYNASGRSIFWPALFHGLANAVSNTLDKQIGQHLSEIENYINVTYAILVSGTALILVLIYRNDFYGDKNKDISYNNL